MGLQTYRDKRKFGVTAEPRGRKGRKKGNLYVIQKHAARRLHYDFRLEHDGVLKSWAVTRGPSLVPGEKRLAVHVEDHPLDYGAFEGTIPKGQYGGGTVMLWDRGTWTPEGDVEAGLKKGHLDFELDGEKLKGRWHLVRMRPRPKEKQESWLLIKGDDAAARAPSDPDILAQKSRSVATKRSLDEIAAGKTPKIRSKVKATAVWNSVARSEPAANHAPPAPPKRRAHPARATAAGAKAGTARPPDFIPPCLARPATIAPDDGNWLHEIKFDGYRIQARLDRGKVTLKTRTGLDWTGKFAPVADALTALPATSALIDGELVVEGTGGVSDFSALQADLKAGRADRFVYYAFDLLHLDGRDLTALPLSERKSALKALLGKTRANGTVRFSDDIDDPGSVVLQHACRMALEGIVSKRRDAPYRSGRTGDWIKTKCSGRQEFVIAGYAPSTVHPRAVGALAMGYYDKGALRYAGRVGTGFTQRIAGDLYRQLDPLRVDKAPFGAVPAEEKRRKDMRWIAPKLVAEVDFRGWTATGILRHAAFKGVRDDKSAREVVREEAGKMSTTTQSRPRGVSGTGRSGGRAAAKPAKAAVAVAGVPLTHPDRVYWHDAGAGKQDITKKDLAEFYADVWDRMAPHVVRRPLALLRCPDGVGAACFMQKHAHATFDRKRIVSVDDHGEEIIAIEDLAGLVALVQAGVLEVHVWGTTIDRLDACDRLVFDLDPGPGVDWPAVIAAAREVHDRLEALGLASFVKTSGGKGLHIVAPIAAADWDAAKDFTRQVTLEMAADSPDAYVAKMSKSLREGRIFVDYLRNGRGATAVAAYSSRARAGAAVSTPVAWSELKASLTADKFTVLNLRQRLARLRQDPWAGFARLKQKLPALGRARKR